MRSSIASGSNGCSEWPWVTHPASTPAPASPWPLPLLPALVVRAAQGERGHPAQAPPLGGQRSRGQTFEAAGTGRRQGGEEFGLVLPDQLPHRGPIGRRATQLEPVAGQRHPHPVRPQRGNNSVRVTATPSRGRQWHRIPPQHPQQLHRLGVWGWFLGILGTGSGLAVPLGRTAIPTEDFCHSSTSAPSPTEPLVVRFLVELTLAQHQIDRPATRTCEPSCTR